MVFLGAFTLVILESLQALFANEIIGKVLTSANLFNFGGVFLVQWITGTVIDYTTDNKGYSVELGFSISFIMVAISLVLSIIFLFNADEGKT